MCANITHSVKMTINSFEQHPITFRKRTYVGLFLTIGTFTWLSTTNIAAFSPRMQWNKMERNSNLFSFCSQHRKKKKTTWNPVFTNSIQTMIKIRFLESKYSFGMQNIFKSVPYYLELFKCPHFCFLFPYVVNYVTFTV